jgi:pimeloyl-ACP methyl ester carboxylesterase
MGTLLLVIMLVPLIGSAIVVGVTFLLAWWVFPGGGSRGPHDTLASRVVGLVLVVLAEYLATVWVAVLIPFRFMQPAPTRRRLYPDRVPVVLLPGYLENRLTLWLLKYRLERVLGVPVRALKPVRYFTGLETLAMDYRRQIEAWMQELGAREVDIVGHSMGGLLGRYLAESGQLTDKIRTVVTIAAPHLGSALAVFGLSRSMRQMRRGSAFLEKLNTGTAPGAVRMVGISSTHDNLVLPWNCALSPRGDNFIIRYRGHLTLIMSREVVKLIARELRD